MLGDEREGGREGDPVSIQGGQTPSSQKEDLCSQLSPEGCPVFCFVFWGVGWGVGESESKTRNRP